MLCTAHLAPIEHDQPFWLKSAELKVEAEVSISFQLQEKNAIVCLWGLRNEELGIGFKRAETIVLSILVGSASEISGGRF